MPRLCLVPNPCVSVSDRDRDRGCGCGCGRGQRVPGPPHDLGKIRRIKRVEHGSLIDFSILDETPSNWGRG